MAISCNKIKSTIISGTCKRNRHWHLIFFCTAFILSATAAHASERHCNNDKDSVIIRMHIYFSRNNGEGIERSQCPKAGELLGWAMENTEAKILLIGWADKTGSADLNSQISLRRAMTIKRYLTRKGVLPTRIKTEGRGVDTASANDSTARRVDIIGYLPLTVLQKERRTQAAGLMDSESPDFKISAIETGNIICKPIRNGHSNLPQMMETAMVAKRHNDSALLSDSCNWSAGLNAGIPFFWGDMLSLSAGKSYIGFALGAQGSYHFSDLISVSLSVDYARGKLGARDYAKDFMLSPDGMTWYVPRQEAMQTYSNLYADVSLTNIGLSLDININRIFGKMAARNRFTAWISPTVYGQFFTASIRKSDGSRYSDGTTRPDILSLGIGGSLSLRYSLTRNIGIQLKNSVFWMTDNNFDGIRTPFGKTKHNASWIPQIGIIWKIRQMHK